MNLKSFSIFDTKTEAFHKPFFLLTEAEAIRVFTQMALDENSKIKHFPSDFALYSLGEFCDLTGIYTPLKTPNQLGTALEYIVSYEHEKELKFTKEA